MTLGDETSFFACAIFSSSTESSSTAAAAAQVFLCASQCANLALSTRISRPAARNSAFSVSMRDDFFLRGERDSPPITDAATLVVPDELSAVALLTLLALLLALTAMLLMLLVRLLLLLLVRLLLLLLTLSLLATSSCEDARFGEFLMRRGETPALLLSAAPHGARACQSRNKRTDSKHKAAIPCWRHAVRCTQTSHG